MPLRTFDARHDVKLVESIPTGYLAHFPPARDFGTGFNRLQSVVYHELCLGGPISSSSSSNCTPSSSNSKRQRAYCRNSNVIIEAQPSSGKHTCFEMLLADMDHEDSGPLSSTAKRVVYVAPSDAFVRLYLERLKQIRPDACKVEWWSELERLSCSTCLTTGSDPRVAAAAGGGGGGGDAPATSLRDRRAKLAYDRDTQEVYFSDASGDGTEPADRAFDVERVLTSSLLIGLPQDLYLAATHNPQIFANVELVCLDHAHFWLSDSYYVDALVCFLKNSHLILPAAGPDKLVSKPSLKMSSVTRGSSAVGVQNRSSAAPRSSSRPPRFLVLTSPIGNPLLLEQWISQTFSSTSSASSTFDENEVENYRRNAPASGEQDQDVDHHSRTTLHFKFDGSFATKQFCGSSSISVMTVPDEEKAKSLLQRFLATVSNSDSKTMLVFANYSRRSCELYADALREQGTIEVDANLFGDEENKAAGASWAKGAHTFRSALLNVSTVDSFEFQESVAGVSDEFLKNCVRIGVGILHREYCESDLAIVWTLIKEKFVRVVVAEPYFATYGNGFYDKDEANAGSSGGCGRTDHRWEKMDVDDDEDSDCMMLGDEGEEGGKHRAADGQKEKRIITPCRLQADFVVVCGVHKYASSDAQDGSELPNSASGTGLSARLNPIELLAMQNCAALTDRAPIIRFLCRCPDDVQFAESVVNGTCCFENRLCREILGGRGPHSASYGHQNGGGGGATNKKGAVGKGSYSSGAALTATANAGPTIICDLSKLLECGFLEKLFLPFLLHGIFSTEEELVRLLCSSLLARSLTAEPLQFARLFTKERANPLQNAVPDSDAALRMIVSRFTGKWVKEKLLKQVNSAGGGGGAAAANKTAAALAKKNLLLAVVQQADLQLLPDGASNEMKEQSFSIANRYIQKYAAMYPEFSIASIARLADVVHKKVANVPELLLRQLCALAEVTGLVPLRPSDASGTALLEYDAELFFLPSKKLSTGLNALNAGGGGGAAVLAADGTAAKSRGGGGGANTLPAAAEKTARKASALAMHHLADFQETRVIRLQTSAAGGTMGSSNQHFHSYFSRKDAFVVAEFKKFLLTMAQKMLAECQDGFGLVNAFRLSRSFSVGQYFLGQNHGLRQFLKMPKEPSGCAARRTYVSDCDTLLRKLDDLNLGTPVELASFFEFKLAQLSVLHFGKGETDSAVEMAAIRTVGDFLLEQWGSNVEAKYVKNIAVLAHTLCGAQHCLRVVHGGAAGAGEQEEGLTLNCLRVVHGAAGAGEQHERLVLEESIELGGGDGREADHANHVKANPNPKVGSLLGKRRGAAALAAGGKKSTSKLQRGGKQQKAEYTVDVVIEPSSASMFQRWHKLIEQSFEAKKKKSTTSPPPSAFAVRNSVSKETTTNAHDPEATPAELQLFPEDSLENAGTPSPPNVFSANSLQARNSKKTHHSRLFIGSARDEVVQDEAELFQFYGQQLLQSEDFLLVAYDDDGACKYRMKLDKLELPDNRRRYERITLTYKKGLTVWLLHWRFHGLDCCVHVRKPNLEAGAAGGATNKNKSPESEIVHVSRPREEFVRTIARSEIPDPRQEAAFMGAGSGCGVGANGGFKKMLQGLHLPEEVGRTDEAAANQSCKAKQVAQGPAAPHSTHVIKAPFVPPKPITLASTTAASGLHLPTTANSSNWSTSRNDVGRSFNNFSSNSAPTATAGASGAFLPGGLRAFDNSSADEHEMMLSGSCLQRIGAADQPLHSTNHTMSMATSTFSRTTNSNTNGKPPALSNAPRVEPPKCRCGKIAKSCRHREHDRFFWGCVLGPKRDGGCGFFEWQSSGVPAGSMAAKQRADAFHLQSSCRQGETITSVSAVGFGGFQPPPRVQPAPAPHQAAPPAAGGNGIPLFSAPAPRVGQIEALSTGPFSPKAPNSRVANGTETFGIGFGGVPTPAASSGEEVSEQPASNHQKPPPILTAPVEGSTHSTHDGQEKGTAPTESRTTTTTASTSKESVCVDSCSPSVDHVLSEEGRSTDSPATLKQKRENAAFYKLLGGDEIAEQPPSSAEAAAAADKLPHQQSLHEKDEEIRRAQEEKIASSRSRLGLHVQNPTNPGAGTTPAASVDVIASSKEKEKDEDKKTETFLPRREQQAAAVAPNDDDFAELSGVVGGGRRGRWGGPGEKKRGAFAKVVHRTNSKSSEVSSGGRDQTKQKAVLSIAQGVAGEEDDSISCILVDDGAPAADAASAKCNLAGAGAPSTTNTSSMKIGFGSCNSKNVNVGQCQDNDTFSQPDLDPCRQLDPAARESTLNVLGMLQNNGQDADETRSNYMEIRKHGGGGKKDASANNNPNDHVDSTGGAGAGTSGTLGRQRPEHQRTESNSKLKTYPRCFCDRFCAFPHVVRKEGPNLGKLLYKCAAAVEHGNVGTRTSSRAGQQQGVFENPGFVHGKQCHYLNFAAEGERIPKLLRPDWDRLATGRTVPECECPDRATGGCTNKPAVWREAKNGRLYWSCANKRPGAERCCNFFEWIDHAVQHDDGMEYDDGPSALLRKFTGTTSEPVREDPALAGKSNAEKLRYMLEKKRGHAAAAPTAGVDLEVEGVREKAPGDVLRVTAVALAAAAVPFGGPFPATMMKNAGPARGFGFGGVPAADPAVPGPVAGVVQHPPTTTFGPRATMNFGGVPTGPTGEFSRAPGGTAAATFPNFSVAAPRPTSASNNLHVGANKMQENHGLFASGNPSNRGQFSNSFVGHQQAQSMTSSSQFGVRQNQQLSGARSRDQETQAQFGAPAAASATGGGPSRNSSEQVGSRFAATTGAQFGEPHPARPTAETKDEDRPRQRTTTTRKAETGTYPQLPAATARPAPPQSHSSSFGVTSAREMSAQLRQHEHASRNAKKPAHAPRIGGPPRQQGAAASSSNGRPHPQCHGPQFAGSSQFSGSHSQFNVRPSPFAPGQSNLQVGGSTSSAFGNSTSAYVSEKPATIPVHLPFSQARRSKAAGVEADPHLLKGGSTMALSYWTEICRGDDQKYHNAKTGSFFTVADAAASAETGDLTLLHWLQNRRLNQAKTGQPWGMIQLEKLQRAGLFDEGRNGPHRPKRIKERQQQLSASTSSSHQSQSRDPGRRESRQQQHTTRDRLPMGPPLLKPGDFKKIKSMDHARHASEHAPFNVHRAPLHPQPRAASPTRPHPADENQLRHDRNRCSSSSNKKKTKKKHHSSPQHWPSKKRKVSTPPDNDHKKHALFCDATAVGSPPPAPRRSPSRRRGEQADRLNALLKKSCYSASKCEPSSIPRRVNIQGVEPSWLDAEERERRMRSRKAGPFAEESSVYYGRFGMYARQTTTCFGDLHEFDQQALQYDFPQVGSWCMSDVLPNSHRAATLDGVKCSDLVVRWEEKQGQVLGTRQAGGSSTKFQNDGAKGEKGWCKSRAEVFPPCENPKAGKRMNDRGGGGESPPRKRQRVVDSTKEDQSALEGPGGRRRENAAEVFAEDAGLGLLGEAYDFHADAPPLLGPAAVDRANHNDNQDRAADADAVRWLKTQIRTRLFVIKKREIEELVGGIGEVLADAGLGAESARASLVKVLSGKSSKQWESLGADEGGAFVEAILENRAKLRAALPHLPVERGALGEVVVKSEQEHPSLATSSMPSTVREQRGGGENRSAEVPVIVLSDDDEDEEFVLDQKWKITTVFSAAVLAAEPQPEREPADEPAEPVLAVPPPKTTTGAAQTAKDPMYERLLAKNKAIRPRCGCDLKAVKGCRPSKDGNGNAVSGRYDYYWGCRSMATDKDKDCGFRKDWEPLSPLAREGNEGQREQKAPANEELRELQNHARSPRTTLRQESRAVAGRARAGDPDPEDMTTANEIEQEIDTRTTTAGDLLALAEAERAAGQSNGPANRQLGAIMKLFRAQQQQRQNAPQEQRGAESVEHQEQQQVVQPSARGRPDPVEAPHMAPVAVCIPPLCYCGKKAKGSAINVGTEWQCSAWVCAKALERDSRGFATRRRCNFQEVIP